MRRASLFAVGMALIALTGVAGPRVDDLGVAHAAALEPDFVAGMAVVEDPLGNGDGAANPGERVSIRLALRNSGAGDATDVRVALDTRDDDVVTRSLRDSWHPRWPRGDTRVVQAVVDIAASTDPHEAVAIVTVSAGNGGPWHFILTFPIMPRAAGFRREGVTVSDAPPGGDGDGAPEPGERVVVVVSLRNVGAKAATNPRVAMTALDPALQIVVEDAALGEWPAGELREARFLLDIDHSFASPEAPLFIHVSTDDGGPWQFSYVVRVRVPTPDFVLHEVWITDPPPRGNGDGRAIPGETVRVHARVQNIGEGAALGITVSGRTDTPRAWFLGGWATHTEWAPGLTRDGGGLLVEIAFEEVAPGAAPEDVHGVFVITAADGALWELPFSIAVEAPKATFAVRSAWVFDPEPGGDRNGELNPSERAFARIRLRNDGPDPARDVVVSVTTDDPDITIMGDATATYAEWGAGSARTVPDIVVLVEPNATPHDVALNVTVSHAHGAARALVASLPLRHRAFELVSPSDAVFDPVPTGDGDGLAEAGERINLRPTLMYTGGTARRDVEIALVADDPRVHVVHRRVDPGAWAAQSTREVSGLAVEIATDARPGPVELTLVVSSLGVEPQRIRFPIDISAPPVRFAQQTYQTARTQVGARTAPVVRLKHIGVEDATHVVVTLVADDPDIIVTKSRVVVANWPAGRSRVVQGLKFRVREDAKAKHTSLVFVVTADGAGPWRFTHFHAIGRDVSFRAAGYTFDDQGTGNGDGLVGPGEAGRLTLRAKARFTHRASALSASLTIEDPAVTVTNGQAYRPSARGLDFISFTFPVQVAPDATAHTVEARVRVTALSSLPTEVVWEVPIVPDPTLPAAFILRRAWVFDPEPGGNQDGVASPGERPRPRVRLQNVGGATADNVRVAILIRDGAVAVVSGLVTHDTWPGGESRNNDGFVLDISPDALAKEVTVEVVVSADGVGPWRFTYKMPIGATPVAAALLANFPNPFNPETWIPFDLAEAADVTVSVYDARGALTRRLDLGRLPAGAYRGRSNAAYWDGRSDLGEQVSSGVYVYELRAGRYREMRRMVVRK